MADESVSGHEADWIEVTTNPIAAADVERFVAASRCGAVVVFLGTVRDHSAGKRDVSHLEYEAYEGVVEPKIAEVVGEARAKWDVVGIAAVHRVGRLDVGDVSVAVGVSSAHRNEAFEAARYVIDELKRRAPIWKKEHWPGGAEWVREDRERS